MGFRVIFPSFSYVTATSVTEYILMWILQVNHRIDKEFCERKINVYSLYFTFKVLLTSFVPRLPRSGTRTLKLCRRGEPGIFSHVRSAKGREEVERT